MGVFTLLDGDGATRSVDIAAPPSIRRPDGPLRSRTAYAAAHVVPLAWADNTPGRPAEIDWDATLAFRRHVYSWASAWPTPWTPRSATWGSTPRRPAN